MIGILALVDFGILLPFCWSKISTYGKWPPVRNLSSKHQYCHAYRDLGAVVYDPVLDKTNNLVDRIKCIELVSPHIAFAWLHLPEHIYQISMAWWKNIPTAKIDLWRGRWTSWATYARVGTKHRFWIWRGNETLFVNGTAQGRNGQLVVANYCRWFTELFRWFIQNWTGGVQTPQLTLKSGWPFIF